MKTKPYSETELVERAKADLDAFGELVERYRGSITRQCFSRVWDRQHAEDLAQETFVRAWLKLEQLREPIMFPNWLRRIASNVCNEFSRGSARLECPWEEVPEHAIPNEHVPETTELLGDLPEQSRLCLDLHYHQGLSYSDIAGILGTSSAAVRNRLHRAKEALRKEMADMTPVERSPFTQRVITKLEQLESQSAEDREKAATDLKRSLEEDQQRQILDKLRGNVERDHPNYDLFMYIGGAIKSSRKYQSPEIRDALINIILHSEYEELRLSAVGAIVAQRDPAAIPFLEQALKDPWNPKEVIGAVKSSIAQLSKMEAPTANYESIRLRQDIEQAAGDRKARFELMKKLVAALEDPSHKVRNQALKALGELGDKRAVPAVVKLLDEPTSKARQAAALTLGKLGSKRATPSLIRLLERESDPMMLQAVIKSLSELGDSSAVPVVIDMLRRTNAKGPALLFLGLGYFVEAATNNDIPAIDDLLADLAPSVGRAATGIAWHRNRIVANHGDERYLPDLIEAAKANSYDEVVVSGIFRIMGDRSLDVMRMLLLSHVNETAADRLVEMGQQGFDVIKEAMKSENEWVRQNTCRAVFQFAKDGTFPGKSGNQEAFDLMEHTAAHDPASGVRFYAKAAVLRLRRDLKKKSPEKELK